jgi:hypothetical protein
VFCGIDQDAMVYLEAAQIGWNDQEIHLVIDSPSHEIDAFFSSLGKHDNILVSYSYNVALCKGIEYVRQYYEGHSEGQRHRWEFKLKPYITDFSQSVDHASRPEHFINRAKRLLLNDQKAEVGILPEDFGKDGAATVDYLNKVMGEIIVAGHNDLKESPLPSLYAQFGKDPQKFINIAWTRLVLDLFTHNIVTKIELLDIELVENDRLSINLRAKRGDEDIIVNGHCDLKGPAIQSDSEGHCQSSSS